MLSFKWSHDGDHYLIDQKFGARYLPKFFVVIKNDQQRISRNLSKVDDFSGSPSNLQQTGQDVKIKLEQKAKFSSVVTLPRIK